MPLTRYKVSLIIIVYYKTYNIICLKLFYKEGKRLICFNYNIFILKAALLTKILSIKYLKFIKLI